MDDIIKQDDYRELQTQLALHKDGSTQWNNLESLMFSCCGHGAANCVAILLELGVDKDCMDEQRMTPLMHAVKSGSVEVAKLLITWGCQINALGGVEGHSALHLAAVNGYLELCEMLVQAGANVNVKNEKEDTPLIVASVFGHLPVVKHLLNCHASINCRGYHECSALHEATEHGHYELCSYLIAAKAGLEDEDTFGNTPLICAAEKGHVNLVLLYLAQGADVNRVSHSGTTALHYAAKEGWTSCCKVLLHHGAEIDAQDIRRFTPLMMAALEGHENVLKLMLDAKCNVNMAAYNRRTALHYAAERGYSSCCRLLIHSGAWVEGLDADLCSPVMLAAWKGNVETTRLLLDYGSTLNRWSRLGLSILHLAAESGSTECCELLLEQGMDINIRGCENIMPVISAIRCHRMSAIRFFISKGCAMGKKTEDTHTVLNEAIFRDIDFDVIEKMLARGASPNTVDANSTLPLWHAVDSCNFPVIKLLLQCNSEYSVKTQSVLVPCSPCSPISHAIHRENPTLIQWLVAAYSEDVARLLRGTECQYSSPSGSSHLLSLVRDLVKQPQSLLRQCRRAIRKQLGCGYVVNQKVCKLKLPTLLHNYMLFSDLDPPSDLDVS
ncbi:ankyrin repeat domain-containing protein 17 [Aplysia californica]|uniref:Ankyrin repeat domain-containing protein 17 n=1 Tax=Aplysia californica TaxID=6500 RepID=A0ABM0JTB6_APLCA|nr:ankyrin repeat domain-containing protein 17 [Aplysia californica]XP_035826313.1 ankyrin repeat domain-containing protein 17 [Aplysia californica]